MLNFIWNLFVFVVALEILITIHEFGHFLVARKCKIQVERFSIGFGKALWHHRDRYGTEYVIALIPLGGYVKMLDERVNNVSPDLRCKAFNNKTILQRASVIIAGPMANFIFVMLTYWLVFIHGIPSIRPVICKVLMESVAKEAQILPGMEFKSIDGIETPDWDSVRMALISNIGNKRVALTFSQFDSSQRVEKWIDLKRYSFKFDKQDPISALGLLPCGPKIEMILSDVQKNSPASMAGLKIGDKIIKVNGQTLTLWSQFVDLIRKSPNKVIELDIERNGEIIGISLVPTVKGIEGFAGIVPRISLPEEYQTVRQYSSFVAVREAIKKTWQLMKITVDMLGKLIIGDAKLSSLSGPISIAQSAGISAEQGMIYYLMFLALISMNLGVINLLPIPILDGGHLLFLAIEKIKGKPVSERVQSFSYHIGSIFLVLLMGIALFNDFSRL